MSFASACEEWAAAEKERVYKATWGHLAPEKDKTYHGHVVWSLGCMGSDYLNPTIMQFDFGELSSSPWFYDALVEFLHDLTSREDGNLHQQRADTEGGLWRWDGTVRNYVFRGIVKRLNYEGEARIPQTIEKQPSARLTKKHFESIAAEIRKIKTCIARQKAARKLLPELRQSNPLFNEKRFLKACNA